MATRASNRPLARPKNVTGQATKSQLMTHGYGVHNKQSQRQKEAEKYSIPYHGSMKFRYNVEPNSYSDNGIEMSKYRVEDSGYYRATAAAAKKNGMPFYGKARPDAVSTRTKGTGGQSRGGTGRQTVKAKR